MKGVVFIYFCGTTIFVILRSICKHQVCAYTFFMTKTLSMCVHAYVSMCVCVHVCARHSWV